MVNIISKKTKKKYWHFNIMKKPLLRGEGAWLVRAARSVTRP